MDRDMNAIRDIMIAVKDSNKFISSVDGMPDDVFKFNAMLIVEAGLAIGGGVESNNRSPVPSLFEIKRLTWEGFEFTDSIKDETIWKKATDTILKPTGSWTVSILSEYLKYEIKNKLGMIEGG